MQGRALEQWPHRAAATAEREGRHTSLAWVASGVFLLVVSVYVLSSPGRIDMIDGQLRYEVARNLVREGLPIIRDPAIAFLGLPGRGGILYSHYGAAGSVMGLPLVWLAHRCHDPKGELSRFLFSLTSCLLGALTAGVLYLFYLKLGVARRSALAWTLVSAFATLLWPASTSTFDNAQHALFALLAVYLGYHSARRRSLHLAALSGFVGGILVLYQEYFILLIPALALSTLASSTGSVETGQRDSLRSWRSLTIIEAAEKVLPSLRALVKNSGTRYLLFLAASSIGLLLTLGYNYIRFGSMFALGNLVMQRRMTFPLLGNPLAGLGTLLVSPGKGILWYSPPIILGFLGLRQLWRRNPALGWTIVVTGVILVWFLSNIVYAAGDWCWGPRYLVPLLPLWALAFPFIPVGKIRRWLVGAVVGVGLGVQLMGLAVDHQRFFFERALPDHFWADDPLYYFKHSALAARPREIASLKDGPPNHAQGFVPSPYPGLVTYSIFGNPLSERELSPLWMRELQVFYLPRPWPLWMRLIEKERRPISLELWICAWLGMALLGFAFTGLGLRCTGNRRAG